MAVPAAPEKVAATILSVIDIPSAEPARIGKTDVAVTYQIDPTHIFQVRVPKEHSSPAEIDAAIKADYARIKPLLGRIVPL